MNINDDGTVSFEENIDLKKDVFSKENRKTKRITLNEEIGTDYYGYFISNVDSHNYCVKISKKEGIRDAMYKELISEEIAKMLDLRTISSKIFKYNDSTYGLISEDYRDKNYNIISGKDIILNYYEFLIDNDVSVEQDFINKKLIVEDKYVRFNSLEFAKDALKFFFDDINIYHKNEFYNTIISKLEKRYLFSFLTMQNDFHAGNWEIFYSNATAFISPLFDMEECFNNVFFVSDDNLAHYNNSMRYSKDENLDLYGDFYKFYNSKDDIGRENILSMIKLLNPLTIKTCIKSVESTKLVKVPKELEDSILDMYTKHYEKVLKTILVRENERGMKR